MLCGAGFMPHTIHLTLDLDNEFTSVQFLVCHVSIAESTLSALVSRVSIHLGVLAS